LFAYLRGQKIMKSHFYRNSLFVAVCILSAALAGCASKPEMDKTVTTNYKPGVPGGSYVETYQTSAKLVAIDSTQRQMSFQAPDGSTNTFIAGPKFQNFESYSVGDQVNVKVARELTAWFAPETPPASANVGDFVRNQPDVKPGVLRAPPKEITATVLAVNPEKQEVTLQMSDGRTATFEVRKDIDLTQVKVGTAGVIRTSAAMALMMEKP
jgi:hypothetical protein